jgi:YidC/Oxa1 family membrane protein insertase
MIWSDVVDVVRALVLIASQACGHSVGSGIVVVSLAVRIALLPLTVRMARRAREHRARIAALSPKLERLRQRHGADQAALGAATLALYREHGIGMLPKGSLISFLIQMPIGAALYRAFGSSMGSRTPFLWITDLARPDAALALACATLAGAVTAAEPSGSRTAVAVNMLLTGYLAWRLSASVALYWAASSSVTAVQTLVLRRSTS